MEQLKHTNALFCKTTLVLACILVLFACGSSYKMLQPAVADASCLDRFQPKIKRALYNAQVNVTGRHLSGLLLMKLMPDSSIRLVFTMESGFKFFDFEFDKVGQFKVHYIIDKMNKQAVITTLRKDFETALMLRVNELPTEHFTANSLLYHRITRDEEFDYYITDSACTQLVRAEKTGGRKLKTELIMRNYKDGTPDTIGITHHNFNFEIGLKKLEQEKN